MFQLVSHHRRVLEKVRIGGQEKFKRNSAFIRSGRIDQHEVQRSAAVGRVDEFDLCHPNRIGSGRQYGLAESTRRPSQYTPEPETEKYGEGNDTTREPLSSQAN